MKSSQVERCSGPSNLQRFDYLAVAGLRRCILFGFQVAKYDSNRSDILKVNSDHLLWAPALRLSVLYLSGILLKMGVSRGVQRVLQGIADP